MSDLSQNRSCRIRVIFTLTLGFALIASAVGQSRVASDHSTALDQADSRAEREAAQLVSLSPEKIISLLREETGLMLEVKKLLVRRAFEQGRILDPEDLTDEALFQLVRDDQKIRVLITQEIEDRAYVRAKPTREELARNNANGLAQVTEDQTASLDSKLMNAGQMGVGQSQEDAYWSTHDNQLQPTSPQLQLTQPPSQSSPSTPSQPSPQTPSIDDIRRQLQLAQMQSPNNGGGMQ